MDVVIRGMEIHNEDTRRRYCEEREKVRAFLEANGIDIPEDKLDYCLCSKWQGFWLVVWEGVVYYEVLLYGNSFKLNPRQEPVKLREERRRQDENKMVE